VPQPNALQRTPQLHWHIFPFYQAYSLDQTFNFLLLYLLQQSKKLAEVDNLLCLSAVNIVQGPEQIHKT
jgi:diadenosine tetraphosphate (Ap4A) HIT family hydrolase